MSPRRDLTSAVRVGDVGRGVRTIIEMVQLTRLGCIIGSATQMRQATSLAVWHVQGRSAFQRRLIDQPLMRAGLADLALDVEASVALVFRLARALDRADNPHEAAIARIGLPIAKYLVTKRAPTVVAEAMECFGGVGFVEETPLVRLWQCPSTPSGKAAATSSRWICFGHCIATRRSAMRCFANCETRRPRMRRSPPLRSRLKHCYRRPLPPAPAIPHPASARRANSADVEWVLVMGASHARKERLRVRGNGHQGGETGGQQRNHGGAWKAADQRMRDGRGARRDRAAWLMSQSPSLMPNASASC
jgi:hypothetical protein